MDNLTQGPAPASVPVPQPSEPFAQQLNSPFLTIFPGELRNEIIRLAVVEPTKVTPEITHSLNVLTGISTAKLEIEHPLMQTCKQLRQESAEIYFLENTFLLTDGFFTQPPLATYEKHTANERAIEALAHAFGPWASKVRRLHLSHEVCYDTRLYGNPQCRRRLADVHLTICCRAQEEQGVYLEDARGCDTAGNSPPLCCCGFAQYAAEHSGVGLFELAQGLVRMMDLATGQRSLPHCWSCGLTPMFE